MPLETEGECRALQQQMALVSRILVDLPLKEYIEKLDRALFMTSMFDPTFWIESHKEGQSWLDLAKALRKAQLPLEKLKDLLEAELK